MKRLVFLLCLCGSVTSKAQQQPIPLPDVPKCRPELLSAP